MLVQLTDDDKKNHKSPSDKPKAIEQKDEEPDKKPVDKPQPHEEEKKEATPNEKEGEKKYKKGDLLGSGSFGSVYKCKCIETQVVLL